MHPSSHFALVGVLGAACIIGCGSGEAESRSGSGGDGSQGGAGATTSSSGASASGGGGSGPGGADGSGGQGASASGTGGGAGGPGSGGGSPVVDMLEANRDRLLGSYFDYLEANATQPQSNGLSSSTVSNVCDVWSQLQPSAQAVFLTLTARLQGSKLGADDSSMLSHVTKVYRVVGGDGTTQSDPGDCGGDGNRMIMSSDAVLHAAQLAASDHQGDLQPNGKYDISDTPPGGTFWRDSHDLGGAHAPFDISNETDEGAPRGQTQYFRDPASAQANAPLGRTDVETLVDPYALEMDQDYNCPHDSNPLCEYTTYGPACFPMSSKLGTEIYSDSYGDFDPGWSPAGCP